MSRFAVIFIQSAAPFVKQPPTMVHQLRGVRGGGREGRKKCRERERLSRKHRGMAAQKSLKVEVVTLG